MEIEYHNLTDLQLALADTASRTQAHFQLAPNELDRRYAPGKWTVRQLLHHLADAETVLYERIRRGIARPQQVVYGFDQDAWATTLDYHTRPLVLSANLYQATRAAVIDTAERFYERYGTQQYVHSETGKRSVIQEFEKVAWHNLHHLKQIEQALQHEQPIL